MNPHNEKDEIPSEDQLALLRWAANQGSKRRQSIPTDGQLLGVLPRENSRETRYSWACVNGHPYLRIQDFQFDVRGATWAPVKGKCSTVRVHELATVLGVFQAAVSLAAEQLCADAYDGLDIDKDAADVHRLDESQDVASFQ